MKNTICLIIGIILLLIAIVIATISALNLIQGYDEKKKIVYKFDGIEDITNSELCPKVTAIQKVKIENHEYILVYTYSKVRCDGIVHNPDCTFCKIKNK